MARLLTPDDKKVHRVITLDIPASDLERFEREALKRYKKVARIPGFRVGKAPDAVVMTRYGSAIKADAIEDATKFYFDKELKARKIGYVSNIEFTDFREKPDGSGYTVTVEFDTIPRFDLPPLSKLEVIKRIKKVTSADVDQEIERQLVKLGEYVPVDREAKEGDFIFFDLTIYEHTPKGKLRPIKKYENRMLALDKKEISEDLLSQFVGKKADDTVELEEDVKLEDGKARKLKYVYHIRSVREFVVPELDDEVAQDLGYESVEDMRQKIQEELEKKAHENSERDLETEIALKIHEVVGFEVPQFMIDSNKKFLRERVFGLKDEPEGELKALIEQVATELSIKEIVIFNTIEEIEPEVTDEEIQEELDKLAKENRLAVDAYVEELKKRGKYEEVMERIKDDIKRRKAWEYLKGGVKVEVVFE